MGKISVTASRLMPAQDGQCSPPRRGPNRGRNRRDARLLSASASSSSTCRLESPRPEVLRLATHGAAAVMKHDNELGSITPGKLADLIVVDGDPTTRN